MRFYPDKYNNGIDGLTNMVYSISVLKERDTDPDGMGRG